MKPAIDFQTMIMTLQEFWAKQGCLIWQPYYTQVGAGTMNPATYLRVLGPEPWNVAYVEPSVRPDDGRFGENPNRLQQHYQFQVILKPDPGNPQEIYLRSLEAIGIDPKQHDIRFVEDNWEQPALGAWGLGWEVWLDGQEITQFTYFQQAGGFTLDPVSVEITYGLERIAMPLQRVRNFRNLRWNETHTYGDMNLQAEREHCQYYFEKADVERLRKMYELFEAEAESALAHNLVLPAHDYVLKCSHTFNVLDTRGAIGVTERQAVFKRMRDISHRISEAYLAQRQAMEFPLLKNAQAKDKSEVFVSLPTASPANLPSSAPFLLEIGTEELPVADLQGALQQLQQRVPLWLDELRLSHGEVSILGTPRRLVIWIKELSGQQNDLESLVKGPPASRAFDAQGKPTPAAEGFARGKGLNVADLQVQEIGGGQYVVALVREKGRPAVQVLSEALPGLLAEIRFGKTMRWNASNVAFSRPVRWLLALFGSIVIPFSFADVPSANVTRGLRFHSPEEITVDSPDAYFQSLKKQGIVLDPLERRQVIESQVKELIAGVGGDTALDQDLLDEVTNLVEAPTALRCQFDAEHLNVPSEVLISVMKHHQRYFPVLSSGVLQPYFITVRNGGAQFLDVVADGNEQVIAARFADAYFFIKEDLRQKLEEFIPRLGTLTFQFKLGSMLDKNRRVERLVQLLSDDLGLEKEEKITAQRAAHLCKADLVTKMVIEMTSLQGVMGKIYALRSGETLEVARAIFEHYLPRFAGDEVPGSRAGLVVGIADRLDSLAGLFAAGMAPSGTRDPFALRRAALGLVQNLMMWNLDFDLAKGLAAASVALPVEMQTSVMEECLEFITGRMRNYLIDQEGWRYDVVEAVLAAQKRNPAGCARAVKELSRWTRREDWNQVLPAYARCVRIVRDIRDPQPFSESLLAEQQEKALHAEVLRMQAAQRRPGSVDDFLETFLPAIPVINRFFDTVMVMAEDPALRTNRLGLLQRLVELASDVADFSCLEGF